MPAEQVDVARSLDPFVLVFDANGRVLAWSATLHSQATRTLIAAAAVLAACSARRRF
ncbi:MAG: hypothetical protein M3069_08195 [Chloroflexota bacterium]|nr:hypothetical protein [Chloroflexota bacterium]